MGREKMTLEMLSTLLLSHADLVEGGPTPEFVKTYVLWLLQRGWFVNASATIMRIGSTMDWERTRPR
jgi:hypothetical protein